MAPSIVQRDMLLLFLESSMYLEIPHYYRIKYLTARASPHTFSELLRKVNEKKIPKEMLTALSGQATTDL